MNIRILAGKKQVGMLRPVRGKPGLVNDQFGGRTETWIHTHNCPMAFSTVILNHAKKNGVEWVVARDDHGMVWLATLDTLLNYGVQDNLGCEDQVFLPREFWEHVGWSSLEMQTFFPFVTQQIDLEQAA